MTPWSVVKDDNRENRPKLRYFRYAVISFTALLVLSLGFALIPAEPPPPADPPFSQQARKAALHDALELRAAAERLSAAAAAGGAPDAAGKTGAVDTTVTLLTLQARALLSPSESSPALEAAAPASPSGLPQPATASPATASPAASSPAAPATPPPASLAGLASALSASGVQRLADAAKADGGMARLLAGAGTAQLLAAEDVAAAGGIAKETLPHGAAGRTGSAPSADPSAAAAAPAASPTPTPASTPTGSACPSLLEAPAGLPSAEVPESAGAPASAGQETTGQGPTRQGTTGAGTAGQGTTGEGRGADVGTALSAAVAAEQQSVYAYQAALPRLTAKDAGTAGAFLAEHEDLAEEAAAQSRAACGAAQPQQPGYVLAPDFLAAPAAGLARLELASLAAFGDVIALADGGVRDWAISALQAAARRAAHWGGDPGPVPGILLDQDQLPDLPASPPPTPGVP